MLCVLFAQCFLSFSSLLNHRAQTLLGDELEMNPTFYSEHDMTWIQDAIQTIAADYQRSADTHLIRLPLAAFPQIDFYFKDLKLKYEVQQKNR